MHERDGHRPQGDDSQDAHKGVDPYCGAGDAQLNQSHVGSVSKDKTGQNTLATTRIPFPNKSAERKAFWIVYTFVFILIIKNVPQDEIAKLAVIVGKKYASDFHAVQRTVCEALEAPNVCVCESATLLILASQ